MSLNISSRRHCRLFMRTVGVPSLPTYQRKYWCSCTVFDARAIAAIQCHFFWQESAPICTYSRLYDWRCASVDGEDLFLFSRERMRPALSWDVGQLFKRKKRFLLFIVVQLYRLLTALSSAYPWIFVPWSAVAWMAICLASSVHSTHEFDFTYFIFAHVSASCSVCAMFRVPRARSEKRCFEWINGTPVLA